jgi:DNA polymerase IV (DinB-like DNA polymerase)
LKYYIGCSGWRNQHWAKDFYPADLDSKFFLSYYSRVFDFVHLDMGNSPFLPSSAAIQKWSEETSDDFRFALKVPQYAVEKRYAGSSIQSTGEFLELFKPIKDKTLCVLVSPPGKMSLTNGGREWIENTLNECAYHGYPVVFEFSQSLWHQDLTYNMLRKFNSTFVWSDTGSKFYYPAVTSDFIFLNIADKASKKNNNEYDWINLLKQKEKEPFSTSTGEKKSLEFAVIVVDTPPRVNHILRLLNLPEKKSYSQIQTPPSLWTGRMIVHIDMNAFFPTCEEIRDPSLKGKPHAVIMTPEKEGNITRGAVASCSYEARKYGVRSAISLLKAKELCPDLILKPVDKQYYGQISDKVMTLLEEYADVLEKASIDEAYIDCTDKFLQQQHPVMQNSKPHQEAEKEMEKSTESEITRMPSTVEGYALEIKNSIRDQCDGLLCSIGVAPSKSAAKIASDFKKPDGLTVVYSNDLLRFLEPLEVDRIAGIGIKTSHVLKEMGINTIGQLAKCHVQKLIDRFGKKNGLWMWRVANGEDNEPVLPKEDNVSLSAEETLQKPTRDKKVILDFLLNELVDDIHERIQRRGYEFKTVGIKLMRSDFTVETRETTFSTYHNNKDSIVGVLEPLLEKFKIDDAENNAIGEGKFTFIRKLGIKVSNLSKINNKKIPCQKTLHDYM